MTILFLLGPRACGKTTIAQQLAHKLKCPSLDMDALLQSRYGTVAKIIEEGGWPLFREYEHRLLCKLIQFFTTNLKKEEQGLSSILSKKKYKKERLIIISTGGGIILSEKNRTLLRENGLCIYLQTNAEILKKRLTHKTLPSQRPSLTGKKPQEEVEEILKERDPLYAKISHIVVNASLAPKQICMYLFRLVQIRNLL